jgi:hypothetical protein
MPTNNEVGAPLKGAKSMKQLKLAVHSDVKLHTLTFRSQLFTAALALMGSPEAKVLYVQLQESEAVLRKSYESFLAAQTKGAKWKDDFIHLGAQLNALNNLAMLHLESFEHEAVKQVVALDNGDAVAMAVNLEILLKAEPTLQLPFDAAPVFAKYRGDFEKALVGRNQANIDITKTSEQVAVDMLALESLLALAPLIFRKEKVPTPVAVKPHKKKRAPKTNTTPSAQTPSNSDPKAGLIASGVTE